MVGVNRKTVNFCYIHVPIINLRATPSFQSKVVSQAIFSERITVENQNDEWSFILTSDGYSGWIPSNSYVIRETPYHPNLQISRLVAHLYSLKDIEYGPSKTLPYRCDLKSLDVSDVRWIKVALPDGEEGYIQKGDVLPEQGKQSKLDLPSFSYRFLGLPYTWGGRSSFGYDCSGFVQMLYQQIGIHLPRDSKQQVLDSRFQRIDFHGLESGDLIFFGNSDQEIKHVGMYLDKSSFIHATSRENQPWIRVSDLTDFEWSGHPDAFYPYRIARQLTR